jgi:hypothetical protein
MKTVTIRPVLNGFVVTVGCSEIVFKVMEDLCEELVRYQRHPEAVEKEYMARAVNHPGPTSGLICTVTEAEAAGRTGMTATEAARVRNNIPPPQPMPIGSGDPCSGQRQI